MTPHDNTRPRRNTRQTSPYWGAAVLALAAYGLGVATTFGLRLDAETGAAWLNAAATLAAVVAAVAAGVYARRMVVIEQERELRLLESQEGQQASLIVIDLVPTHPRLDDPTAALVPGQPHPHMGFWRAEVTVRNASLVPIYDCHLHVRVASLIPGGATGTSSGRIRRVDVGVRATVAMLTEWVDAGLHDRPAGLLDNVDAVAHFGFRDSNGLWWMRSSDGQLQRATRDEVAGMADEWTFQVMKPKPGGIGVLQPVTRQ